LKADLSFVVKYSDGGDDYTHGLAWQPGMMDEFEFLWDGDKAAISSDLVRKASEKGAEAVTALLDRVAAVTSAGKIEIEPGFADAFKAFRDGDGEDLGDDEEEATSVHP
jgi:hypothetical protein